jgi:predicted DCC family thiol-disulfide oxidoreductase YuxK
MSNMVFRTGERRWPNGQVADGRHSVHGGRMADPSRSAVQASAPAVTVWFDGACPLCTREMALMRRLDRRARIRFVDVADPSTSCPIDRSELLARFHAEEQGRVLSGAAAFAAMWRAIPVLRPIGLLARLGPVERLLERMYIHFLRWRPALQRRLG